VRAFVAVIAVLAAIWLVGAAAQGILFATSLTSRRIWLFTWWFEKFAFGMVVGFALGAFITWLTLRGRSGDVPRRRRTHAERTEEELAALREELSIPERDR
jgi:ABC-type nickel/cobalt efflux system permease component RcnA